MCDKADHIRGCGITRSIGVSALKPTQHFILMQATVQAALALLPRDAVIAVYGKTPTTDQGRRYAEYAQNVLTTAVFCILICGSIGTLLIRIFAPVLLQRVSLQMLC